MFLVHEAMEAINKALEVIFSAASVTCSPQYASVYPNLSANKNKVVKLVDDIDSMVLGNQYYGK